MKEHIFHHWHKVYAPNQICKLHPPSMDHYNVCCECGKWSFQSDVKVSADAPPIKDHMKFIDKYAV